MSISEIVNMDVVVKWLYRWSVVLLLLFVLGREAKSCKKKSSCSCQSDEGILNLKYSAIRGIKFKDEVGGDSKIYSYNPCYSFDETDQANPPFPDACKSVAACQIVPKPQRYEYYDIGTQNSASFSYMDGNSLQQPDLGEVLTVQYWAGDKARTSVVILKCNQEEVFFPIGEIPFSNPPTYVFFLSSPDACFLSVGLSAGTVLLIIFLCAITVYLIGGILFNKIYRKENGITNLIPHKELWVSLPGLVKDGFIFLIKRGQYQPIKG